MRTACPPTERASEASARPDAKRPHVAKSKPPAGGLSQMRQIGRAHSVVGQDIAGLCERLSQLAKLASMPTATLILDRIIGKGRGQFGVGLADLAAGRVASDPKQLEVVGLARDSEPLEDPLAVELGRIAVAEGERLGLLAEIDVVAEIEGEQQRE